MTDFSFVDYVGQNEFRVEGSFTTYFQDDRLIDWWLARAEEVAEFCRSQDRTDTAIRLPK